MSSLSDFCAASPLVDTLLRVSLASTVLFRPITDTQGQIVDFAFVYLNALAQQRLGLPERPTETCLTHYPHATVDRVLTFYRAAFTATDVQYLEVDYPHDGQRAYFRLAAQRCEDLLVVSFTDLDHQHYAPAEAPRHARKHAAWVTAEAQHAQLQQVLDQAPALLCTLAGPDLVVDFTNAAYQQLVGGRALRGKPIGEALPEIQAQGYLKLLTAVYHTGELYQAVEEPATMDFGRTGTVETRYFTFSYQPRRDAAGRVDGVIVLGYDATEQVRARQWVHALNQELVQTNLQLETQVQQRTQALRQAQAEAESQQARLERLFRAAPAIVNTNLGPDHVFELVHPLTDRLFGFRPLAGLPIRAALPDVDPAFFALMDEVYRTGQPFHGRGMPVRFGSAADGSLRETYFDFTYQPLPGPDGQIEGVMTFAVDVTEQVRARQQAERNEARFRRLAETAPLIVWEADAAGQSTYLSPHWAQITQSAPGAAWHDYVHPDDQPDVLRSWHEALRTSQPFQHEMRLRLATGEYRWFLDRAQPVFDAEGRVVQWVGAAADIDAQKQVQQALQASEHYFRQMADVVPALIWQTDASGACVYLNASWYAYTGQEPADALGYGWQRAVHPDDVADVEAQAWPAVAAGQPFTVVYRLQGREGHYRWVTDSGRPRLDAHGTVVGYIGSVTDIDERTRAEHALQQLTDELRVAHERAQDLNAELATRNEQLQRLNVELDTFVYMASHDLRAPLLNIEGLVQALQEELPAAALPTATAYMLDLLQDATRRFTETVEHLTEVARAQQQLAPVVPLDLLPVIHEVLLDLQPLIEQTQAEITIESSDRNAVVALAPKNARSVVYNLLSNALKYRHPERVPHVRVACHWEAQYLVLTVQDNGLGLAVHEQVEVFAPFQRLHDHVAGYGIGLYMIKRIVENAGGRIQVESEAGGGTTFRVYLPG